MVGQGKLSTCSFKVAENFVLCVVYLAKEDSGILASILRILGLRKTSSSSLVFLSFLSEDFIMNFNTKCEK